MAQPLKEWASGKAGMVADKVYSLLTRYTGVKFKICPTFHAYKNKWGVFFGKFALASNGRYYRLNFSRGATDEIVSMDVWGKGQDALMKIPAYTCSFEGFGISKIILYLKDFILSPEHNLTEHIALDEDAAYRGILHENSDELKVFIAAFLEQDPGWQKNWASGTVDPQQYFKTVGPWIKSNQVNGAKYSGDPVLTTIAVTSNTKSLIKKNPAVLGANAGAARAAQIVPSVAVVKSSVAGAETPIDLSDAYDEKVTFDQIQAAMVNNKKGPLAQMAAMKESIGDLFEQGDYGETMVVIWGRGGIGKTRTLKDTMEELGLSQGEHYVFIPQTLNRVSEGGLQKWIIDNAKKEFLVINDNDNVFKEGNMNTWKQVLEHDPKWGRHLQIEYPPGRAKQADEPEPGDYEIKCKFVWLSNVNPDQWLNDPSGAMKSRYISVEYNFTDEEVMGIIADSLDGLYPEFEDVITQDDKAKIFNLFWKAALKRKALGQERTSYVSFRAFNDALEKWWFNKAKGVSFDAFAQKYLNAKLNATRA
jgi:ribosomal protein L30/L7E